jgi:hypothetical protein
MNQFGNKKSIKSFLYPISKETKNAKIETGLDSLAQQIEETKKRIEDLKTISQTSSVNPDEVTSLYTRLDQQSKTFNRLDQSKIKIPTKIEKNIITPEQIFNRLSELSTKEFVNEQISVILPELFPIDPKTEDDLLPNKQKEFKRMKKKWDQHNNQRTDEQRLEGFISLYQIRIKDLFDQYFVSTFSDFTYKRKIDIADITSENEVELIEEYITEFRLVLTGLLSRAIPNVNIYPNSNSKDGFSPGKFAQFFGKSIEETISKLDNNIYIRSEKQHQRFENMGSEEKDALNATLLRLAAENEVGITEKKRHSQRNRWSRYSVDVKADMVTQTLVGFEKKKTKNFDLGDDNMMGEAPSELSGEIYLVDKFRSDIVTFPRKEFMGNLSEFQPRATILSGILSLFNTSLVDNDRKRKIMHPLREIQKKYVVNPNLVTEDEKQEMQRFKAGALMEDNFWKYVTPVLFKNVKNCIAAFKTQSFSKADLTGSDIVYLLSRDIADQDKAVDASKEFLALLMNKNYSPYLYLIFEMCFGEESMDTMQIVNLEKEDVQLNLNIENNLGFLTNIKLTPDENVLFNEIKRVISNFDQLCVLKSVDIKARESSLKKIKDRNSILYEDVVYPIYKDGGIVLNDTAELLKNSLQD